MEKAAADLSADDLDEVFDLLSKGLTSKKTGVEPADAGELRQAIEPRVGVIFAENDVLGQDAVAQKNLLFTSLILASYHELRERLGDNAATVDLLREAFTELFQPRIRAYIKQRFDVDIDHPNKAFENITANFVSRGETGFGAGFSYEQERQSEKESFINVTRCSFLDFFKSNNAPELTFVICAMDAVWAEELNNNPYNVSFDRPSLMSKGSDKCRFQFTRT